VTRGLTLLHSLIARQTNGFEFASQILEAFLIQPPLTWSLLWRNETIESIIGQDTLWGYVMWDSGHLKNVLEEIIASI
jgi:hypothetical protein